jgi:hypothetical protein
MAVCRAKRKVTASIRLGVRKIESQVTIPVILNAIAERHKLDRLARIGLKKELWAFPARLLELGRPLIERSRKIVREQNAAYAEKRTRKRDRIGHGGGRQQTSIASDRAPHAGSGRQKRRDVILMHILADAGVAGLVDQTMELVRILLQIE